MWGSDASGSSGTRPAAAEGQEPTGGGQPAPSASGNPLLLPVRGSCPVTAPRAGRGVLLHEVVARPGPVVGGVGGLVGLVVSGTVTGTEVEPCSPNVVVVVASVVVVDSLHIGWVVVVGPVVSGTVTGPRSRPPRRGLSWWSTRCRAAA